MSASDKQLSANRENAKKGGVKTEEGKAIVRHNARKHGLLAKEIVITQGEGAESQEEFDSLLTDLQEQFNPESLVEAMLVEKIAVSYWRLRRAYRYEVGLIREKLDNATDEYYENKHEDSHEGVHDSAKHLIDPEIDKKIQESEKQIKKWTDDKNQFSQMHREGKDLKEIYGYGYAVNWIHVQNKFKHPFDAHGQNTPAILRKALNQRPGFSDDKIWEAHIELCDERIAYFNQDIVKLGKDKVRNKLRLQVVKMKGSIPAQKDLDRLLRYETTIERQFYKAMDQLERLQRFRAGDNVPPPMKVSVDVNAEKVS